MTSSVFFRLDDIGPVSRKASYFIDLLEELGEPYLLAVIPKALNWWSARQLRRTRHAVIFQHGYEHRNHATDKTPDEFPDSLGLDQIATRVRRGRQILADQLSMEMRGYVPPYNRISDTALRILEEQGYSALSSSTRHATTLSECPIHVDVYTSYRPVRVKPAHVIQAEIDAAKDTASLVGIMLHPLSTPRAGLPALERCISQNTAGGNHRKALTSQALLPSNL